MIEKSPGQGLIEIKLPGTGSRETPTVDRSWGAAGNVREPTDNVPCPDIDGLSGRFV
jgi:hypothetical protein